MTTSPSLLDAALASRSRIAAAKRRALAVRKNASGRKAQPSCLRGAFDAGSRRCCCAFDGRWARGLARLHVRVATACSAQCTIRRFVRNEVVVGRLNDAKAQVVGQKESTIDALREAAPSAAWCYVACKHAVDSRCRIAESFDIVVAGARTASGSVRVQREDAGARATAAPSRNRCTVDADG